MRWYEIRRALFEDRTENLRRIFLERLKNKFSYENLPDDIKSQIDKNKDFSNELFDYVMSKDPTKKKIYTQWLLNSITRNKNPMPIQDIPDKATNSLTNYHQKRNELRDIPESELRQRLSIPNDSNRKINPVKVQSFFTLSELDAVLGAKTDYDKKVEKDELDKATNESIILDENDEWIILIPKTEYAAQFWGRGTEWCTAWGDPKGLNPSKTCRYKDYPEPIFTIRNKKNVEKSVQLYLGDSQDGHAQFMNYKDLTITGETLESWKKTDIFKKISDYIKANQDEFSKLGLLKGLEFIDTGIDLSDENHQLKLVKEDAENIIYILKAGITPEENVQLAAVSQYGYLIEYILRYLKTASEEIQLAAVNKNGRAIRYILNYLGKASENVQLTAVNQTGYAIVHILYYLGKASENVQLAAVNQDGHVIYDILRYLKIVSEKVWLTAFKDNNIWYLINQIYRLMIGRNIIMPPSIQLFIVKNKPEHFNKDIITDPRAIEYMRQNHPEKLT